MGGLGPFGTNPHLAIAVSGGADSTALALLADHWAQARGGTVIALIADHGLRQNSTAEAVSTACRMAASGIASQIITLAIAPGAAMQERARTARHAALATAAAAAGAVHLLFGHHAGDQAELLAMRAARGTGGAAGMAALSARHDVIVLRPLLGFDPAELRAELNRRRVEWIEDPSNTDPRFERVRVRLDRTARQSIASTATTSALSRAQHQSAIFLSDHSTLFAAGFAVLRTDRAPPEALAALIRTIGGATYPPRRDAIARLADALRPATLGGVQIMPAGRLGAGWLLCREPAACAPPIAARPGAIWDGRFRIRSVPQAADRFGCLGVASPAFRTRSGLPSAILRGLPAFFRADTVIAVPHCQPDHAGTIANAPPAPVAALAFTPAPFLPPVVHACAHRSQVG